MLPPPRFVINGLASLANKKAALTLISNILSQASSLASNTCPTVGFTAAFDINMSKPPYSLTAVVNKAVRSSLSPT